MINDVITSNAALSQPTFTALSSQCFFQCPCSGKQQFSLMAENSYLSSVNTWKGEPAPQISDSGHQIDQNSIGFLALKAFIWKM